MPETHKRNPNTKCTVCGKLIYKRPIQIKRNSGKVFCSAACFGISCRKEKPCVVCGKPILSGLNKSACSRACANIHRAGIKYKLSGPRKDKVKSQRALKLRLVSDRGRVCERCGYDRLEILQVHHKNRNRNDNELNNLELICPNCHFEEHYLERSWLKGGEKILEGSDNGIPPVLKTGA